MQRKFFKRITLLLATAALMLNGCSGDNGANGTNGTNAVPGAVNVSNLTAEDQAKVAYTGEVTGVTVGSATVVNFKVSDGTGSPVVGLGVRDTSTPPRLNNLKFALAKLVPGTNGSPSKWVSYIVTTSATPAAGQRPSQDREGALVDNGDGTYTYTFYRDITKVAADVAALTDSGLNLKAALGDLTYDPSLTHRLVIEYGGNIINTTPSIAIDKPMNIIYDFIPATGKTVTSANTQREIATTAACNECHGAIGKTTPHGGRADIRYCAVCHTSQRAFGRAVVTSVAGVIPATASAYVVDGETLPELVTMIHKIHAGSAIAGTTLTKTGYNYAGLAYETITGFPMSPANCRVCHKAENSLQGDNWNMKPSRQACGSCHDAVNFATGVGHSAGNIVQTSDASCAVSCHNADAVKGYHMQVNKTVNNPVTPAGLVNFTYEVATAAVNSTTNALTVKFRILGDGAPVTLAAPAAAMANPLVGFTGGPSFMLPYAQSGAKQTITTFADYNNLGKNAAQPGTVSIANLLDTNRTLTSGTITGPDASGYYTANIVSAVAFPVGAKLRAVALQGYFTQVSPAAARHTVSVIKAVTGDAVRRSVVDSAKCGKCHEWFEGHGGNRVYEVQVCVGCHVPNLSSSGRGVTDAFISTYAFTATETAILTSWAFDKNLANAALLLPEASNNFKDMIHAIHAGKDSSVPMRFLRDRGTVLVPFETAGFGFPNLLKNCDACHISAAAGTNKQTYKADLPAGVLPSTAVTTNGAITTPADVKTSRLAANLPNTTDVVTAPIAAACVSCHTSAAAVAHMNSNGARIATSRVLGSGLNIQGNATRSIVITDVEQCALCHGEGKVADVVKVHAK